MSSIKDDERMARAKRVQTLRDMTKLSRREFAKKTGIPNATLQHWEDGETHTLPEKSARRLIKALLTLGVHCSYDWIMHGKGGMPEYLSSSHNCTTTSNLTSSAAGGQKEWLEEELAFFMQRSKHAISLIVPDDAMEPRFTAGELVAGIRQYGKDIEKLIGLDCIVLIQGSDIHLRTILKGTVEGCFNLVPTNPKTTATKPFFYNVELVSAAPVIWARRTT